MCCPGSNRKYFWRSSGTSNVTPTLSSVGKSISDTFSLWKTPCGDAVPSGIRTGSISASRESISRSDRYSSAVRSFPNTVAIAGWCCR